MADDQLVENAKKIDAKTREVTQAYDCRSDRQADSWQQNFGDPKKESAVFQMVINAAKSVMLCNYIKPNELIVDAPSGPGTDVAKYLRLNPRKIVCIDGSEKALREGEFDRLLSFQRRPPALAPWIRERRVMPIVQWMQQDLKQVPPAAVVDGEDKGKVDVAVCFNGLHYLDIPGFIKSVSKDMLRPGGYLLVLCLDSTRLDAQIKEGTLPPWFMLSNPTENDYQLILRGLTKEKVTEQKIDPGNLIALAESEGFVLDRAGDSVASCSVWHVFQKFRDTFVLPSLKWPHPAELLTSEQLLLETYRFYVFVKKI